MNFWKKKALFLIAVMSCTILFMVPVRAEENEAATNDIQMVLDDGEPIQMGSNDVSEHILKLGGFLPSSGMGYKVPPAKMLTDGQSNSAKTAEDVLYEGLKERADSIDISAYNITAEDLGSLFEQTVNEHPELIYVTGGYSYSYGATKVFSVYPNYNSYTKADVEQLVNICEAIVSNFQGNWTDEQKILYLHDYVVTHCRYDDITYAKYNAYNCLVEGSAVCQGYSEALMLLGKYANIEIRVLASSELNHAWNLVKINGKYYHMDATWDDPVGDMFPMYCKHVNFLRSRAGITSTGHTSTDWVATGLTNAYNYGVDSTEYEEYFWSNVITAIPMIENTYAYAKNDDNDHVFLRTFDGTESAIELSSTAIWMVWDDEMHYYPTCYISFAAYDGNFYFSTPQSLGVITPAGVIREDIYELDENKKNRGYIYGIGENENGINYWLATKSREVEFEQKLYEIPKSEKKLVIQYAHTCTVGNDLSLNYYVDAAALTGYENIRLVVEKRKYNADGSSFELRTKTITDYSYGQTGLNGEYEYKFRYTGLFAYEMGDELVAKILADKDGVTYESNVDQYSIKTYALNNLKKTTISDKLRTLLVDMLNYGAEAQIYFKYNTNNLVNRDLTDQMKEWGTTGAPELTSQSKKVKNDNATSWFNGHTLIAGSNIELKYYMKFNTGVNMSNVSFRMSYVSASQDPHELVIPAGAFQYDAENDEYACKISTISTKDFGSVITAGIYDGDTLISETDYYSIGSYIHNQLDKNTVSDELKVFLAAMGRYAVSAQNYFQK